MTDTWKLVSAKFDGEGRYHPLVCHMLDVAAVAKEFWRNATGPGARGVITNGLGLRDESVAERWVSFLAGAHDLGKATPLFQSMDPGAEARLIGLRLPQRLHQDPPHGDVTAALLPDFLEQSGIEVRLAARLSEVTGGHHGLFVPPGGPQKIRGARQTLLQESPTDTYQWNELRENLLRQLAEACEVPQQSPTELTNAAAMALAGLISVVDWVGSMAEGPGGDPGTGFFPFHSHPVHDVPGYWRRTQERASIAAQQLYWLMPKVDGTPTFGGLFGFEPRRLQEVAVEVAATATSPGLVVVEAPMGEGKTEAALYLLDHWAATAGVRGAYVAMPTMATSNQMYDRFRKYLLGRVGENRAGTALMLAHGHASLREDLERLPQAVFPAGVHADDGNHGSVGVAEWFSKGKRALLAPYGVGTIDQALMSVLQVKHNFVRLFGLTGKPVLIDEVHAYDTYMTTLLERLLHWLAALGSPVVLLSATLPSGRRARLMAAYQRGLGPLRDAEDAPGPTLDYPRITWLEDRAVRARHIDASAQGRTLYVRAIGDANDALVEVLRTRLMSGGCAAVICNTVTRAQETYHQLRHAFPDWGSDSVDLFHARFVHEDRQQIEDRVLRRFGPGDAARPARAILVATQVVEQSLDLDFDLMVSDPAPLDLLLQRSGRMMRHVRTRPSGFRQAEPTLFVRWESADEAGPTFDGGTTAVYDEHILLRTWWALRGRPQVRIPSDVQELIDSVYPEIERQSAVESPNESLGPRWEESRVRLERALADEETSARLVRVDRPWAKTGPLERFTRARLDEESAEVHLALQARTRNSGLSVSAVVLEADDPLSASLSAPNREETRRLLQRSVSISARRLVGELLLSSVPPNWQRSAWLSHHRLIRLGPDGRATVGTLTLEYDNDTGLRVLQNT